MRVAFGALSPSVRECPSRCQVRLPGRPEPCAQRHAKRQPSLPSGVVPAEMSAMMRRRRRRPGPVPAMVLLRSSAAGSEPPGGPCGGVGTALPGSRWHHRPNCDQKPRIAFTDKAFGPPKHLDRATGDPRRAVANSHVCACTARSCGGQSTPPGHPRTPRRGGELNDSSCRSETDGDIGCAGQPADEIPRPASDFGRADAGAAARFCSRLQKVNL